MERNIVMIALFAALIAALGLLPKLTLAAGVPITAQTLGVMLAGTILGAKRGALAVLLFMLLVAMGLPLLAGGRGGLGLFVGPTAGFLFGWPLAAFVTGLVVSNWRSVRTLWAAIAGSVLGGIVVLYVPGILGMALVLDKTIWEAAAIAGAFVPGDVLKAVLAGFVTSAYERARPGALLSRP